MATAVAVMLAAAGATVVPFEPARAYTQPLVCEAGDPNRPANGGPIIGFGSAEHAELQDDLYIPAHETRCPSTAGTVAFTETLEVVAIERLVARQALFVGLNQPLSTRDWARALRITTLPLMIDGFVVTANVPCPTPAGAQLKLTARTLSLVYTGDVAHWEHPALLADNPWLLGCPEPLSVAAKFGGAWSTAVLKDYLSHANPVFAHYEKRENLDQWPLTLSVDCAGTTEADMVACASQPGTISYVHYATAKANGLTPVLLTNGDGATPPPAANAADGWPSNCPAAVPAELTNPHTGTALGFELDWSTFSMTNGKGYPLCAFGYAIVLAGGGPAQTQAVHDNWRDHLRVMWSDTEQDAMKAYGYAPLPDRLQAIVQASAALQS